LNLVADSPNNLIAKLLEKEREGTEQKEVAKIVEKLQKEEREKAKEKRQLSRIRRSSLLFRTAPLPNISRPPPITLAELEKSLEAKEQSKLNKDTSVQEFDEDVYKEQELSQVSTLGQRLNALPGQSRDINSIYPRRKHLLTRRSKRCTVCDKVLIKPDLSPSKIEFKRQHMAIFYLPKVTIASISKISTYEISVLLKFTNPVHNLMHLNVGNYTGTAVKPIELSLPGPTFIAGKDFDEEDQDEEYKNLKSKDDSSFIKERKSNYIVVQLSMKLTSFNNNTVPFMVGVNYTGTYGEQSCQVPICINVAAKLQ